MFSGVLARLQHGAEIERATDAMIAEAGRQIELQFESEDGRDIKTIGMMTVSLAAGAFVATGHPVWDSLYGLPLYLPPLLTLVLSLGAFVMALRTRRYMKGTAMPALYWKTGQAFTMIELKGFILAEMIKAIETNEKRRPGKSVWYTAGCYLLIVTFVLLVVGIAL